MTTTMRTPASTYRLQFSGDFGFEQARAVVPYLHRLGVDWVYASPLLRATGGSTHGYDVCDPGALDPRLGTREQFDAFSDALRDRGMGLLLDIVPNHMAASIENPWWRDVLANGRASRFADHFAIDWDARADGKLLLPVLGAPLAEVLARGELSVVGDELAYADRRLPLAPGTASAGDVAAVVAQQHYRPDHWQLQASGLNYRRFFDISDLVAVRAELPHVFDATHAFVLELVREGRVQGLRVDHVDGLADPKAYLVRLQRAASEAAGTDGFFVVVEKILHPTERLRAWPVAGTTGYDFIELAEGPLADPAHMVEAYGPFSGDRREFGDVAAEAKLQVATHIFAGELAALARAVSAELPDLDDQQVHDAVRDLTIELPVYRTYLDPGGGDHEDRQQLHELLRIVAAPDAHPAAASPTAASPAASPAASAPAAPAPPEAHAAVVHALLHHSELAQRWQQLTGPVTAKSVEDTAFYRWPAAPWRTEVGCDPEYLPDADDFHHAMARRAPHTLNAGTTHDTKRSEQVRARMMALTAPPHQWTLQLLEWARATGEPPDRSLAWLALHTIVGAWPIEPQRLSTYLTKAMREAKQRTTWIDVDEPFERAMHAWVERAHAAGPPPALLAHAQAVGERTALAMLALRLFAPGVPDVYQGTELDAFTLVDPDNRRPVDFALAERLLDTPDAPARMRLVAAGLRARRDTGTYLTAARYVPLHVPAGYLGFARELDGQWLAVVVPTAAAPAAPSGTSAIAAVDGALPAHWRHLVTDAASTLDLPDALASFPVAVLASID